MAYRKFNIYEGVRISEKILSAGILTGLAALVAVIAIGSSAGFTASFVTGGDQMIEEQHLRYGETVKEPSAPTRDGYVFDGWYTDSARTLRYDFEHGQLQDDITLYAAWHEANTAVNAEIEENKGVNETNE